MESGSEIWLLGLTIDDDLEVDLAVHEDERALVVVILRGVVSGRGRL